MTFRAFLPLVLFAMLCAPQCWARPTPKFVPLPDDSGTQAPAEPTYLPETWGPIFPVHPKYPIEALRRGMSGFALAWIRYGADGCPQRIEFPDHRGDALFINASVPVFVATRAVVPAGEAGPWWHLAWTTFHIEPRGKKAPEWEAQLQSLRPDWPSDEVSSKELLRAHRALARQKCPLAELLVRPQTLAKSPGAKS